MNERDLQILAAVGETLKEALADRDVLMSDRLKAATDQVDAALQNINLVVEKAVRETSLQLSEALAGQVKDAVAGIEFPDFNRMVSKAVADIQLPEAPQLPDIGLMVKEAVTAAVAAIKLPEPEALPDIKNLVAQAVAGVELPQPEKVDLDALAIKAADLIAVPQPEALPDIAAMVSTAVDSAVAGIELPQPAEIDLDEVAQKAAELIVVPQAPELPDIGEMVKNAVANIVLPEPEKVDLQAVADLVKMPEINTTAIAKAAAELVEIPEPVAIDITEVAKQASELVPLPAFTEADLETISATAAVKAAGLINIPQEAMLKAAQEAVAGIKIPEAPDFASMLKAAIADIELPEPVAGVDGKDALQLEILPEIDKAKSYPRGTYASHDGGLWRTYEKSHGMRGWECVMNGVARTEIKASEDLRTVSFVNTLSDGTVTEKHFDIPVVIDRGVFKHGNTYKHGDAVTWGGSLWVAQEQTADKPGEPASKGWRLAVKKGKDAK